MKKLVLMLCLFLSAQFSYAEGAYDSFYTFGSKGSETGQFALPKGLAVDKAGNIYVADSGNHRIQVFDANGTFIRTFGSEGTRDGQFMYPNGVVVDEGNIYVADQSNHLIQVFDRSGTFIRTLGSHGTGDGQFNRPADLAIDTVGNILVADTNNHRIQVNPHRAHFDESLVDKLLRLPPERLGLPQKQGCVVQ